MGKMSRLGNALYEGDVSIDFVGRRMLWYTISGIIVLVAVAGLYFKGLNMGIEFEGGVEYRVAMAPGEADQQAVEDIRDAVVGTGIDAASAPIVNTSGTDTIRVQTEPMPDNDDATAVSEAIQEAAGVGEDDISQAAIGATWGQQVADRALIGLGVFTVLVVLFIWAYFREWKMSVAALVALVHDVVITVGVYAISGFEVTPATVTGVLTILGFSLYDTVVVFDKVRENTKNLSRSRKTYREAANLAVNQTLVRSINTSIVALLPVGALLYAGVVTLGSGALKDLALALFVGMAAGAYSSIFIATPLLVQLKMREPAIQRGDARATTRARHHEVDRYAAVPVFTDDMPVHDEPTGDDRDEVEDDVAPSAVGSGRAPRYTAGERPASRAVSNSASAKRAQPSRKPRSQRGKK
ncbi:protein translocase subunit SecF [Nocardioides sp. WL0053]|uniref:Protein-export membrane protein SecF n=1 Tax=Nocardioides jiangsuensis TaxID=2866161 RepID=A0ABS7RMB2_9ACTN|nr:protein translocase subunit SecF [Nocardioides jiangsuensis]MBY9076198.1 protein translocase subunit SecF [Nocardioides jiangsuensis]